MNQTTTFEFTYSQNGLKLQVTATAKNRPAGVTTDIDSVMYNGIDVYDLLEAFDVREDLECEAERMGEYQFVNSTEMAEYD